MKYSGPLIAFVAVAAAAAIDQKVSYDGYKVVRIPLANLEEGRAALNLIEEMDLQPWKSPYAAGDFTDLILSPSQIKQFENRYAAASFSGMTVMHEDLGLSIAQENNVTDTYQPGSLSMDWFSAYHPFPDHMSWLKDLQGKYPKNSAIISAGKSTEGNDMAGIHIWGSAKGKPAVIFHGTLHAREWIIAKIVEFAAQKLLEGLEKDEAIKGFLEKYDFFIYPIINPDGFKFTSSDRMWRKNRAPNGGDKCKGVDINRNWDYKWGGPGASPSLCHETYRGPSAASEPETKNAQASINDVAKSQGVALYIDWHSYSQLILAPYSYDCSAKPPRLDEHMAVVRAMADGMKSAHGQNYKTGQTCRTLYQVSGGSTDYAMDVSKVGLSIIIESRDTGKNGFIIPANLLRPTVEESWAGTVAALKTMK